MESKQLSAQIQLELEKDGQKVLVSSPNSQEILIEFPEKELFLEVLSYKIPHVGKTGIRTFKVLHQRLKQNGLVLNIHANGKKLIEAGGNEPYINYLSLAPAYFTYLFRKL